MTETSSEPLLLLGDCLDCLREMPDNSVDSVVTDPPYGLSFMGKKWDYDVPSEEIWRECLRVLKPGGHLLAFAGTRTQHRMAVRIEDAGFEIRDMIAWVYGSGFPKSLDVSKAIDATILTGGSRSTNIKRAIAARPGESRDTATLPNNGVMSEDRRGGSTNDNPATPEAQQWQGWGTALKPALEPITVARKPLGEKTVAANVLAHGTGAINVDGCRIKALTVQRLGVTLNAWEQEKNLCNSCARLAEKPAKPRTPATKGISVESHVGQTTSVKAESTRVDTGKETTGCFAGLLPEELASDQTDGFNLNTGACGRMATEQFQQVTKSTTSTETVLTTGLRTCNACGYSITDLCTTGNMPASKSGMPNMPAEQENVAPTGRWPSNLIHNGSDEVVGLFPVTDKAAIPRNGGFRNNNAQRGTIDFKSGCKPTLPVVRGDTGSAARFFYCAKASKKDREGSTHPTMKPTALMRYLCRLVTPPEGIVLDPFMGSGSTGKAAMLEGFQFIGIERDEEYMEIAKARISAASNEHA